MLADSYKNAKIMRKFEDKGKSYAEISTVCDRCGGRGLYAIGVHNSQLVITSQDGGICYKCHGAGNVTAVVRDYTEAEFDALQRAKTKRQAKKTSEFEERKKKMTEAYNANLLLRHGFNETCGYKVIGNTFNIKDQLKADSGRFTKELGWVVPEIPENIEPYFGYIFRTLLVEELFEYGEDGMCKLVDDFEKFVEVEPYGEHLGTIGQKLTVEATLVLKIPYHSQFGSGHVYVFETVGGNKVTWSTGSAYLQVDKTYLVTGKVKEHTVYKDVKQTALKNCKVEEIGNVSMG